MLSKTFNIQTKYVLLKSNKVPKDIFMNFFVTKQQKSAIKLPKMTLISYKILHQLRPLL